MSVVWNPAKVSLQINSLEVETATQADGKVFLLSDNKMLVVDSPIFSNLDLRKAKNDREYLFLGCVVDIEQKLREGSAYNIIRAAGILRQLFLDDTPLIHQVNRDYKMEVVFETSNFNLRPPFSPEVYWVNLDASHTPGAQTIKVDLQRFMKAPCLDFHGKIATVKDIIKACANVKGGVHLGRVQTEGEQAVLDLDLALTILGQEPSLTALSGISRVALKGLEPLANIIVSGIKN